MTRIYPRLHCINIFQIYNLETNEVIIKKNEKKSLRLEVIVFFIFDSETGEEKFY